MMEEKIKTNLESTAADLATKNAPMESPVYPTQIVWAQIAAIHFAVSAPIHVRFPYLANFNLAAATCYDWIQNGNETDVDCGGPCSPCTTFQSCLIDADCLSLNCVSFKCGTLKWNFEKDHWFIVILAEATCTDDILNQNETDTDCGGPNCRGCADNKICNENSDCMSFNCDGNTCSKYTHNNTLRILLNQFVSCCHLCRSDPQPKRNRHRLRWWLRALWRRKIMLR